MRAPVLLRVAVFLGLILAAACAHVGISQKGAKGVSTPLKTIETTANDVPENPCSQLSPVGYATQCARLKDKASTKRNASLSWRDGGKLFLRLSDGKAVFKEDVYYKEYIQDRPQEEQKTLRVTEEAGQVVGYSLHHFYQKPKLFLVGVLYYEGTGYLLIDQDSGREFETISEPTFSPSGERFVAASLDLGAGYNPNAVEVWEKQEGHWRRVFYKDFESTGYDKPRWVGNDKLILHKYAWINDEEKPIGEGSLVFSNRQWKIIE